MTADDDMAALTATLSRSMTEDQLLTAITEAATLCGWLWTHHRRSDRAQLMGHPGFPDLALLKDKRLLLLELKAQRGRLSPGQRQWMGRLHAAGLYAYTIRPSDLDMVLMWLRT